jgi:two-component system LytT family response regulator
MLTAIIIDDEPKARLLLSTILQDFCKDVMVVALCEDLPSGVKAIKKENPNLVFLDIEMPGHSGLELLEFFKESEINFSIIFTTAYNEFALKAFKFSAIDYLLKPLEHSQVVEAVERYKKISSQYAAQQLKQFQQNLQNKDSTDKRIIVPSSQSIHFLKPNSIIMIKGDGAYCELFLEDNSKILASKNLKHFQEALVDNSDFIRSHKSYIINKQHIKQYVRADGGSVLLSNNLSALISSDKLDDLLNTLK